MSIKESLISVKDLTIELAGQKILKEISFEIYPGDFVGIVGPNGGGKSTLIKSLLGLIPIKSGSIKIRAKRIGYVPQLSSGTFMNFPITVCEVLRTGLEKTNNQRMTQVLELIQISHLRNRLFNELSGGERQKVLIARALIAEPDLLILDEPLSAVDHKSQGSFYELLQKLHREKKLCLMMITHDVHSIAKEANRLLCLNQILYDQCEIGEIGTGHILHHQ